MAILDKLFNPARSAMSRLGGGMATRMLASDANNAYRAATAWGKGSAAASALGRMGNTGLSALVGGAVGGVAGGMSDEGSFLGGAAKGAVAGLGVGLGARMGGSFATNMRLGRGLANSMRMGARMGGRDLKKMGQASARFIGKTTTGALNKISSTLNR